MQCSIPANQAPKLFRLNGAIAANLLPITPPRPIHTKIYVYLISARHAILTLIPKPYTCLINGVPIKMYPSLAFLLAASSTLAVAAPSPLLRRQNTREYDVLAAPDADVAALLEQLGLSPANDGVFATFDNARFRGFSGAITEDEVAVLRRAEGVLSVREAAQVVPAASRSDATWGLQRISQAGRVSAAGTATGRG